MPTISLLWKDKLNTKKSETTDLQAILLLIIIGIQIIYSGFMILLGVLASASLDLKLLANPAMLFSLGIWVFCLQVLASLEEKPMDGMAQSAYIYFLY